MFKSYLGKFFFLNQHILYAGGNAVLVMIHSTHSVHSGAMLRQLFGYWINKKPSSSTFPLKRPRCRPNTLEMKIFSFRPSLDARNYLFGLRG